jgi:hypothetical protein
MGSQTRKLLLIGATGYERSKDGLRLDCVSWDKIGEIENVRDYDVLVLNLLSIGTEAARRKVDWDKFNKLLDFPAASDILTHRGRIIVLGDPRFEILNLNESGRLKFLNWTGATFAWDSQPGDTVKFAETGDYEEFKDYAKHLRKWNYSLDRCSLNAPVFEEKWDLDALKRKYGSVSVRVFAACSNRYGHSLAFCIQHQILDEYNRTLIPYGYIYLLPEISLDEDETLLIVLRDFCDAASELPEPEWVSGFNVPGQKAIDEKIAQIKATLAEQQSALEKAMTERMKVRTCLKLLYEREYALEPVVRNILRELGATVEDPVEKNKEDGWVTIQVAGKTYEGVLEIKSAKSDQFSEDGRRQVLDWIERGRTLRDKNYKGIFIGNSAVTKPLKVLSDRPNAFSDSWKKAAKLSQICAMKSEELFLVYLLHKQGKVNLDEFWAKLFATDGIFDIKPFLPIEPKQTAPPAKT